MSEDLGGARGILAEVSQVSWTVLLSNKTILFPNCFDGTCYIWPNYEDVMAGFGNGDPGPLPV